jgi:hypothetical protein
MSTDSEVFKALFNPEGVVFFGSLKAGKIGYEILKSNQEGGFKAGFTLSTLRAERSSGTQSSVLWTRSLVLRN